MYDELIKMLRTCSERDSCIGWKEDCPYLGTGVCDNKAEKAADAIEKLSAFTAQITDGRFYFAKDGVLFELKNDPREIRVSSPWFSEPPKEE